MTDTFEEIKLNGRGKDYKDRKDLGKLIKRKFNFKRE